MKQEGLNARLSFDPGSLDEDRKNIVTLCSRFSDLVSFQNPWSFGFIIIAFALVYIGDCIRGKKDEVK